MRVKGKMHVCYLLLFVAVLWLGGCTAKAESSSIDEVTETEEGKFTCKFAGNDRSFYLYVPENAGTGSPLLFVLHSYGGNAENIRTSTKMNDTADKYGYAVVYPNGRPDPTDKTSNTGWNSGIKETGNDDVGFLVAVAKYLQENYGFSSQNTFATGFSNGAFMVYRLASDAPDTFHAVASVAGFMPEFAWAGRQETSNVGILQINGTKDNVVPFAGSTTNQVGTNTPTIEEVIDYWKEADQLTECTTKELSEKATATCYSAPDTNTQVWYIVIEDGRHSWPQEQFAGFDVNEVIFEFFELHRE